MKFQYSSSAGKMKKMVNGYQMLRPICIKDTGLHENVVEALEESLITDDKKVFCYLGCILKKMKIVRHFFNFLILHSVSFYCKIFDNHLIILFQINGTGKIKEDQMAEFYQLFKDDKLNENAKKISSDLLKALKKTKGVCEAGRITIKYIRTIVFSQ